MRLYFLRFSLLNRKKGVGQTQSFCTFFISLYSHHRTHFQTITQSERRKEEEATELFTSKSRQSTANEKKTLCGRKTIEPTFWDLWASFNRFKYFPFQMFNIQLISHTLSLFICLSAITFTFYDSTIISSLYQQIIDSSRRNFFFFNRNCHCTNISCIAISKFSWKQKNKYCMSPSQVHATLTLHRISA